MPAELCCCGSPSANCGCAARGSPHCFWAIHPVQVESVAWIAEIKNTLSGTFYFFAAWCYLNFDHIGDDRRHPASPPLVLVRPRTSRLHHRHPEQIRRLHSPRRTPHRPLVEMPARSRGNSAPLCPGSLVTLAIAAFASLAGTHGCHRRRRRTAISTFPSPKNASSAAKISGSISARSFSPIHSWPSIHDGLTKHRFG